MLLHLDVTAAVVALLLCRARIDGAVEIVWRSRGRAAAGKHHNRWVGAPSAAMVPIRSVVRDGSGVVMGVGAKRRLFLVRSLLNLFAVVLRHFAAANALGDGVEEVLAPRGEAGGKGAKGSAEPIGESELWGHIDITQRNEIVGVLDGLEGNVEGSLCLRVRLAVEVRGLNIRHTLGQRRREQHAVGADLLTVVDLQHVADEDVLGGDVNELAVSQHMRWD